MDGKAKTEALAYKQALLEAWFIWMLRWDEKSVHNSEMIYELQ